MRVPSSETEHHVGKSGRYIPLVAELRQPLLEVFELAEPGVPHVITRYRDGGVNLRTQFQRMIRKAGFGAWPKLWHNLRASRQTELAESYPLHVVCDWIGNSRMVAQAHYLQVTDQHFQAASQCGEVAQQRAETVQEPNASSECL